MSPLLPQTMWIGTPESENPTTKQEISRFDSPQNLQAFLIETKVKTRNNSAFTEFLETMTKVPLKMARNEKIKNKNISTHSLRKSGSRFIWENNGHSDEYLIKLSSILNHSSTSITRRYLGISREEIKDIYQFVDEML